MDVFPVELVSHVAAYLSDFDARRLAWTSRRLRAIITPSPVFFLHIEVACRPGSAVEPQLSRAHQITDYAIQHNIHLAFTLNCNPAFLPTMRMQSVYYDRVLLPLQKDIFAALTAALPRTISLKIAIPTRYASALQLALQNPVPRLRMCTIARVMTPENAQMLRLSDSLFSGLAPRLQRLSLSNVAHRATTTPAWANVHTLTLQFTDAPAPTRLSALFPSLRRLRLRLNGSMSNLRSPKNVRLDFRDLNLDRLDMFSVHANPVVVDALRAQICLSDVPTVTRNPFHWDSTPTSTRAHSAGDVHFWDAFMGTLESENRDPLQLFAGGSCDDTNTIFAVRSCSDTHRSRGNPCRVRAFILPDGTGVTASLVLLPSKLVTRLVEMHLTTDALGLLLSAANGSSSVLLSSIGELPTLTLLTVELEADPATSTSVVALWQPDDRSRTGILRFPRLKAIRLYARVSSVNVSIADVVRLAQVLKQPDRPICDRARLELQNVLLKGTKADENHDIGGLYNDSFPRVVYMAANDTFPPLLNLDF